MKGPCSGQGPGPGAGLPPLGIREDQKEKGKDREKALWKEERASPISSSELREQTRPSCPCWVAKGFRPELGVALTGLTA